MDSIHLGLGAGHFVVRSGSPSRMASSHWLLLLSVLSLASGGAPEDPCAIKAKDAALEPRCVYRAPGGEPAADGEASVPRATDRRVWELSAANARFALSLYRRVALGRSADSNVFLSPLGVSAAFSVTKLGACGRTLEELVKVFELDSVTRRTSAQAHFYLAKLLCRLQRRKDAGTELAVATRLFGDRSLRFDATFQNISRRLYGAEMMSLDLRGEPEASRGAINAWVANKTENNIRDALPAGAVGADAVLVLVNSIYFKGRWLHEFREEDAYVAPFRVDARRSCSVRMMFQENSFRYARLPARGLRLLEMDYRGRDLGLTLLLPDEGRSLAQVRRAAADAFQPRLPPSVRGAGGGGARPSHAQRVAGADGGDARVRAPSAIPAGGRRPPQGGAHRARTARHLQPAERQFAGAPGRRRRRRRFHQRRLPQSLPGGERAGQRGGGVLRRGGVGKIHQVGRGGAAGRSALPAADPREDRRRRPLRGPRGEPLPTVTRAPPARVLETETTRLRPFAVRAGRIDPTTSGERVLLSAFRSIKKTRQTHSEEFKPAEPYSVGDSFGVAQARGRHCVRVASGEERTGKGSRG